MIKQKKKTKLVLLVAFTFIAIIAAGYQSIFALMVNCWTPGGGGGSGGGGSGDGGGSGGGSGYGCPGVGRFVYCETPIVRSDEQMVLNLNAYDTDGNFIGSALSIKDNYQFLAGRFVGIDAYDDYQKTFYVNIHVECRQGVMVTKCTTVSHRCSFDTDNGMHHWVQDCSYTVCWEELECHPCSASTSECRPQADAVLASAVAGVDKKAPHVAKRQDVNDITKGVTDDANKEPTITVEESKEYEYVDYGRSEPTDPNSSTVWRTFKMRHTYNLTSAWIDPVTGKVKYERPEVPPNKITDTNVEYITEDEKKTYIEVLPDLTVNRNGMDVKIGKYFVPLNAKSTDWLKYYLMPNTARTPLSPALCRALIEQYSDNSSDEHWSSFLKTINNVPLSQVATNKTAAISAVAKGCYTELHAKFKIKQGFYNEVNGDLKGYSYYYRPIDYNLPFPNGLSPDGYWANVYDVNTNRVTVEAANGEIPDSLSKSFEAKFNSTYSTDANYKYLKKIRDYNKLGIKANNIDAPRYSNWTGIDKNGTSSFISADYGVSRDKCQEFYALGCGPSTTNAMRKVCDARKAKVCNE